MKRAVRSRIVTMIAASLLAATVYAGPPASAADAHIGTWELDLARSSFSPGPAPQRQTLTYFTDGQQLTALLQGLDNAGHPLNPDVGNLIIYFDGRDHPTARPGYDTSRWDRVNDKKYIAYRKKNGKVVLTSTNEVSADGRTLTITTTGVDESGRAVHDVRVYVKK